MSIANIEKQTKHLLGTKKRELYLKWLKKNIKSYQKIKKKGTAQMHRFLKYHRMMTYTKR